MSPSRVVCPFARFLLAQYKIWEELLIGLWEIFSHACMQNCDKLCRKIPRVAKMLDEYYFNKSFPCSGQTNDSFTFTVNFERYNKSETLMNKLLLFLEYLIHGIFDNNSCLSCHSLFIVFGVFWKGSDWVQKPIWVDK